MASFAAPAAQTAVAKDLKDVPPFHIIAKLQNKKQAVSEKVKTKVGNFPLLPAAAGYMLPEKMVCSQISKKLCSEMKATLEGMGVEVAIWEDQAERVGNRFVLGVLLLDYDTDALCREKGAGWIKRNAAKTASDVNPQMIGRALRQVLMQKMLELVPQKVAEKGAKIDIEIPELEESGSFPVTRALVQPVTSVVKNGCSCLGALLPCGRMPADAEMKDAMSPRKRATTKPSQPLLAVDAGGKGLSPSDKAPSPCGKAAPVAKH